MSSAAKSLFAFGIYAIATGIALILIPATVLNALAFPAEAQCGFIRVVGALAMVVGSYHIVGARNELLPYIRATVWGRVGFAALLGGIVLMKLMPMSLLLFAAIDLAGAAWTAMALRQRAAMATA